MRLLQYLTEMSYTELDIPKHFFWVVFRLEDAANDLKRYTIDGVSGISSSKEIVMDFLGVARNALLIMPSKETEQMNKLTRIMYDNPYYLLQDNMKALARIWQKEHNIDGVIFNLFEYVLSYWKKNTKYSQVAYDGEYFAFYQRLSYEAKNIKGINGPRDLAKWVMKTIKKLYEDEKGKEFSIRSRYESFLELTLKDWEHSILEGLKKVAQIYGGESEWLVKDKKLKISKNSILIVLKSSISDFDYSFFDFMRDQKEGKIKNIPKKYEGDDSGAFKWYRQKLSPQPKLIKQYGLDKKYKVKYLGSMEFDKLRKNYLARKYR